MSSTSKGPFFIILWTNHQGTPVLAIDGSSLAIFEKDIEAHHYMVMFQRASRLLPGNSHYTVYNFKGDANVG